MKSEPLASMVFGGQAVFMKFSSSRFSRLRLGVSLVLGLCCPSVSAKVEYTITEIRFPGGSNSFATAINDLGQVAGGAEGTAIPPHGCPENDLAANQVHAFLWSNGSTQDLGTLPGAIWSYATGINVGGSVVGRSGPGDVPGDGWHGFLVKPGQPMVDIGTLANGLSTGVNSINANGEIVGGTEVNGVVLGVHWDAQLRTNAITPGGSLGAEASGINEAGMVTGISATADDSAGHAFLWWRSLLIDPEINGNIWSWAFDINNQGQSVRQIVGCGNHQGYARLTS